MNETTTRSLHRTLPLLLAALIGLALTACTAPNPDYTLLPDLDLGIAQGPGPDLRGVDLSGPIGPEPDLSHPVDLAQPKDLATGGGPSCTDLFGAAPDFMLCVEQPTVCVFYLKNEQAISCAAVCGALASAPCEGAWDVDTVTCTPISAAPEACTVLHHDQLCACHKPF
jgi:hypothetical protein